MDAAEDSRSHLSQCLSLDSGQKEKLEELFQHIISNAPIDYSNKEVQDIQTAVYIMMERIKERVNSRGIFNIVRIVKSGSMAEKTSIWKFDDEHNLLEFDFLASLETSIMQCKDNTTHDNCRGCIKIVKPPMDLERLCQYYSTDDRFNIENPQGKRMISDIFLNEINTCLTSSCHCLIMRIDEGDISFQRTSDSHKHCCEECTVNMPTGTLSVNIGKTISHYWGKENCSLIFTWTSNALSLSAPDKRLLEKQTIHSLPVFVDFLPALESKKNQSPSNHTDEYDYFVVPKNCNVCERSVNFWDFNALEESMTFRWRKSCCLAEINAFTTQISDKHKRCYQIMKHMVHDSIFHNYCLKTVALQHHTKCSDATADCVQCVIGIFREILQAVDKGELLAYQSNLNILKQSSFTRRGRNNLEVFIRALCSVCETDSWESFVWKVVDMPSELFE